MGGLELRLLYVELVERKEVLIPTTEKKGPGDHPYSRAPINGPARIRIIFSKKNLEGSTVASSSNQLKSG